MLCGCSGGGVPGACGGFGQQPRRWALAAAVGKGRPKPFLDAPRRRFSALSVIFVSARNRSGRVASLFIASGWGRLDKSEIISPLGGVRGNHVARGVGRQESTSQPSPFAFFFASLRHKFPRAVPQKKMRAVLRSSTVACRRYIWASRFGCSFLECVTKWTRSPLAS